MALDRSKPFATVYPPGRICYRQDGKAFNQAGEEVDQDGRPVSIRAAAPPVPESGAPRAPAAAPPVPAGPPETTPMPDPPPPEPRPLTMDDMRPPEPAEPGISETAELPATDLPNLEGRVVDLSMTWPDLRKSVAAMGGPTHSKGVIKEWAEGQGIPVING